MMVVGIYFSPTGGTRRIAAYVSRMLAHRLDTDYRLQSYTLPAERTNWQPIDSQDIIVWASPVYAGKTPNKMLDFATQALQGHGNKGIAIAVFGNRDYDNALAEMTAIMCQGGITPIAAAAIVDRHVFAANDIASDRPNDNDFNQINNWIESIDLNTEQVVSVPGSADAPYYRPLKNDRTPANFLKAKPQLNVSRCHSCGQCQHVCPMGSITFHGTPDFGGICIKCQACIQTCTSQALSFNDPDFISHVDMLCEHHSHPAANSFFC